MASWIFIIGFIIFIIILLIIFGAIWFSLPSRPNTPSDVSNNSTFVSLSESEYNTIHWSTIIGFVLIVLFIIIGIIVWLVWGSDFSETDTDKHGKEVTVTKTEVKTAPVEHPTHTVFTKETAHTHPVYSSVPVISTASPTIRTSIVAGTPVTHNGTPHIMYPVSNSLTPPQSPLST